MDQRIPTPGDGRTFRPAENANTADDTPAAPTVKLNSGVGGPAPQPLFNPRDALLRLRMRFPNLQIIPVPNSTRSRVLAANVAEDITLPDGTLAILFFSTAPFYANFEGLARVPSADSTESNGEQNMLIPQNFPYMLWVQGKRQFSVLAEQAAVVQAFCYIDIPKEAQ